MKLNKNVNDTRDYKESVVAEWDNCLLSEGCSHPIYKASLKFLIGMMCHI